MAKAKKPLPKKAAPTKPAAPAPKATPSNTPSAVFNIDEITELLQAVKKSNMSRLKLEKGDFKITIEQGGEMVRMAPAVVTQTSVPAAPAPVATATPAAPAPTPTPSAATGSEENLITIKSPMIGTFYRSSGPGKPVFVNVGDDIKEGQVLCIVEAMKLFNEIESEHKGKIVKVLVDDASPVEYDQPLFLLQP